MTEQEYVDATNLAKLRASYVLLHDCLAMRAQEEGLQGDAKSALRRWIDQLERTVAIDPQRASASADDNGEASNG